MMRGVFWPSILIAAFLCLSVLPSARAGEFTPEFQKGVCFSHNHSEEKGYGTEAAAASLADIRALGATHVSISPIGYSFNRRHPDIFGYRDEDLTLTRERLVKTIGDAHRLGLKVCLNPHLWIGIQVANGDTWRGKVAMTTEEDWKKWFASYESFILYFARVAEETGVELFCVGSELEGTTVSHPEPWRSIIRQVRGVYHGPCTYSANWSGEFEQIPFWDELEYLGISAYFPLPGQTRDEQRAAAMQIRDSLAALHERTRKPILFLESGFQSQAGAASNPGVWQWNSRAPTDLKEQKELFDLWGSVFWNEPWFYGVYWWNWYADESFGSPDDNTYSFRGKPSQEVVRRLFATPYHLPTVWVAPSQEDVQESWLTPR